MEGITSQMEHCMKGSLMGKEIFVEMEFFIIQMAKCVTQVDGWIIRSMDSGFLIMKRLTQVAYPRTMKTLI